MVIDTNLFMALGTTDLLLTPTQSHDYINYKLVSYDVQYFGTGMFMLHASVQGSRSGYGRLSSSIWYATNQDTTLTTSFEYNVPVC